MTSDEVWNCFDGGGVWEVLYAKIRSWMRVSRFNTNSTQHLCEI